MQNIDIWTDGTTAGFNVVVNGVPRYFNSYETAHAELVRLGVLAQPAAVVLDNAMRRAADARNVQ
jgi:hypothetical protein